MDTKVLEVIYEYHICFLLLTEELQETAGMSVRQQEKETTPSSQGKLQEDSSSVRFLITLLCSKH